MTLQIFGKTDIGLLHRHNEDHVLVLNDVINTGEIHVTGDQFDRFIESHKAAWIAVADGIGGTSGGDVASRITLEALIDCFSKSVRQSNQELMLKGAMVESNQKVLAAARENQALYAMGSTICGLFFRGSSVLAFYAGDSRIYRWRNGVLALLSKDDARPGLIAERAGMSLEEAVESGSATITNYIGTPALEPHVAGDWEIATDDIYLICSDGLYGMVPKQLMAAVLENSSTSLVEKGRQLNRKAIEAGGCDNISLVLVAGICLRA